MKFTSVAPLQEIAHTYPSIIFHVWPCRSPYPLSLGLSEMAFLQQKFVRGKLAAKLNRLFLYLLALRHIAFDALIQKLSLLDGALRSPPNHSPHAVA